MRTHVISLGSEDHPDNNAAAQMEQETVIPIPRFNNQVRNMRVVRNIVYPTLTAYLPDPEIANGTAVVICPGGGFSCLPIDIEGNDAALWLNKQGVAAFVLRYRLLPTALDDQEFIQQMQWPDMARVKAQIPLAIHDGLQAVREVRTQAAQWDIDSQHVGILGFSAGGVVASGVCAQAESEIRPNFLASIYSPGSPDLIPQAESLPLFIAFASDDPVLSMVSEGSMRLYSAWKEAGHPVELHIYSRGGHGFGMAQQHIPCDHWIDRFGDWMHIQGFLAHPALA